MIYIGVDPGLTGAIAFIDTFGTCTVEDLPTMQLPGNGMVQRKIDGLALAVLIRKHWPGDQKACSFVEQVGVMGGKNNAIQTQGSLMRSLGAIEAALEMLRIPPVMLHPKTWKGFYGLGKDKKESLQVARALYPDAESRLARVKDHNRAEAVLLAHHGLRSLS